jgi:hypothetical protein
MEKLSNSILNQKPSTGNKRAGTLCTESYATKQVERATEWKSPPTHF